MVQWRKQNAQQMTAAGPRQGQREEFYKVPPQKGTCQSKPAVARGVAGQGQSTTTNITAKEASLPFMVRGSMNHGHGFWL
ncbi:rCG63150 [Rattus norvegicus]|uniref:RCG63150 n=1 Tax=Rattus norvegicus TaxID=10116 RepID=A6K7W4_RAT|nr:rCG63150 [Rattus norvegicus]